MKLLRMVASVSALMAGERARIFKAIPGVLPESQMFTGFSHSCYSFQFHRFKSSKGLLFKLCNEDDDFSELGPPVEKSIGRLKLMTEKPNYFLKLDNGRKVSSSKSPRSKRKQNIKGIIEALDKPHQTSCEFGNGKDASAVTNASSDAAKANCRRSISVVDIKDIIEALDKPPQTSCEFVNANDASAATNASSDAATASCRRSISLGNVPSTISLSQLVEAASVFGKVRTASVRHLPDSLNCWDIQFENPATKQLELVL